MWSASEAHGFRCLTILTSYIIPYPSHVHKENLFSRLVKQEHNCSRGSDGEVALLHKFSESVYTGDGDRACDAAVEIAAKILKGTIDGDSADLYMFGSMFIASESACLCHQRLR